MVYYEQSLYACSYDQIHIQKNTRERLPRCLNALPVFIEAENERHRMALASIENVYQAQMAMANAKG